MTDILRITDEATREEIAEALMHLNASAKRIPRHFTERKAAVHARIDALLDEWLMAP